jgi:hypothetical protein
MFAFIQGATVTFNILASVCKNEGVNNGALYIGLSVLCFIGSFTFLFTEDISPQDQIDQREGIHPSFLSFWSVCLFCPV